MKPPLHWLKNPSELPPVRRVPRRPRRRRFPVLQLVGHRCECFFRVDPGDGGSRPGERLAPANVPAGSRVPLVVSIGGQTAPPVFIATR